MFTLKNEFLIPPIKLGYTTGDGKVNNRYFDFYNQRSKNIGAVTIEPFYLDKGLRELPNQLGIDNDDKIEGISALVNLIHKNGAKVIAHLNHPGRMANPKIPGNFHWSSTDAPCENGGAKPQAMNREMMDTVIQLFVDTAKRAEKAGFDFIELQFGLGHLLAQFLSPAVNNRTDEYNGNLDNRAKFPFEVFDAVKDATDIPIITRISADEIIPNGFHLDEMKQFAQLLEKRGAAAIHVAAGSACSTPPWFFQHMFIPKGKNWELASKIKEVVSVPVISVGQINSFDDIKILKEQYKADYIAVGRALVADPDFTGKYLGKIVGNVRPCLACSDGCLGNVKKGKGLKCLVNPTVNTGLPALQKAEQTKKVAVIGGGLAGMEAAITLKHRGHSVDLFEKEKPGGQFNYAPMTPKKRSMKALVPYYLKELKNNNINVIQKEVGEADINAGYDAVVFATGAVPTIPQIEGLNKFYWAEILLKENLPENKNVLIIGGGLIGVDIATALIPKGNKITIVKRTTDFGEDMEMIAKALSLKMMKEAGTVFSDYTHIKKVDGKTVYAERNGEEIEFNNIDLIVVSTGMKSYIPFQPKTDADIYYIGDARKVSKAEEAIHDAYELALKI
jgi:2,4-dienoyl-CoA reductase-like NADH-dependent reductase (Old Yellow Enzyme family)/thioredoxin reductase